MAVAAVNLRESARRFHLVLIKPSHYDDDGYVIQWWRSPIPSNSLASVYGLALDVGDRKALGAATELSIAAIDETNARVRPGRIIADIRAAGDGMVMLVGVQTNQFPRALDLARVFRKAGIKVGIGGFHVSGTIAMLPVRDPDVAAAEALGVSLFAGEAEGRMEDVLKDAMADRLKPLYNFMDDLPGIEGTPIPFLPAERVARTAGGTSSFDAGRGCPYQCSFCTIINVQGRKSRRRSPDDIERIIRENNKAGIHRFFITDDNFARNKDWEAIFDRMIALRESGVWISATIQVDTLCHKLPNFVEKAAKAGVRRVFIGLENINPDSLMGAKKKQNKITDYRTMLLAWKDHGVISYAGYIIGFPGDTKETVLRDVDIIMRELPVDILEFFFLTPLPGSEDHKKLHLANVPMNPDMNGYDLNHAVTAHPKMSKAEWEETYHEAWKRYFSNAHIETVLRRTASAGIEPARLLFMQAWFRGAIAIEGVHPLECGVLRRKSRKDRRAGMPLESPLLFYPKFAVDTVVKLARWSAIAATHLWIGRKITRQGNEKMRAYSDTALDRSVEADEANLDMFQTSEAKSFIAQQAQIARATKGEKAAA
jgi:Radical SAM superfamily